MRMGCLTFDQEGLRFLPYATLAERVHMLGHICLVRKHRTTTVKAESTAVWDQVGRWPANRELEQTILQICFAESTEIIKMPLGLRYIVPRTAVVLGQARGASSRAFSRRVVSRPICNGNLPVAARALSVSLTALMTSFVLDWNLDVITDEFKLNLIPGEKFN